MEQRFPLSRAAIVAAAVAVADRDGLDRLSMRRLGRHFGVEAMSLYNHVPNKAALLDAMVDEALDAIPVPTDPDWRTGLRGRCLAQRRVFHDHRWALGIEHLLFVTAGLAFWWPALVPGRMRHGSRVIYLAAAFFLAAPVALLIALAGSTIYPYYDTTPHLWGLTPLEDQSLGGMMMAVEQSVILFVAAFQAFTAMMDEDAVGSPS